MNIRKPTRLKLQCGRPAPESQVGPGWIGRLETYVRDRKLKRSAQRERVVQAIASMRGHFRTQDISRKVSRTAPTIGVATIYRSIRLLCDAKILKETLVDENGETVYELASSEHHDHMVCVDCDQIFEFQSDRIETLQDKMVTDRGFSSVTHHHVLYVKCTYFRRPPH